ncbi:MAG: SWIM zinc finger family protein [Rubrobacter sp.]|nr:SWIM zinc finger family protein [Rubrobacter sp.]
MDSISVAPPARHDTREMRALAPYRERGAEIVRTGPHTYLVPSCSGGEPYAVDYERESCDCPDFTIPRRGREVGEPCKHVYAVGIHRAKRRGTTVRRLAALEEMYRHEILDEDERLELRDRIHRIRGGRS